MSEPSSQVGFEGAHRIRLHGPWWLKRLDSLPADSAAAVLTEAARDLAAAGYRRVEFPYGLRGANPLSDSFSASLLTELASASGWVAVRPFRIPTGINAGQRVLLQIRSPCAIRSIALQDEVWSFAEDIGAPITIDLTDHLSPSGAMRLTIRGGEPAFDDPTQEVAWPFETLALVIVEPSSM